MSDHKLSVAVQQLVWRCLRTVDHLTVLLAMRTARAAGEPVLDATSIAARAAMTPAVASTAARELVASGALRAVDVSFTYAPDAALAQAVDELAETYATRPVTLVRAIYDRPASVVQLFADAFRLRPPGEDG